MTFMTCRSAEDARRVPGAILCQDSAPGMGPVGEGRFLLLRAILTDVQFWIPVAVLMLGAGLLAAME